GGQYVYVENTDLIDAMSPTEFSPVSFIRTEVYRTDPIRKAATANSVALNMLADRATEQQTITCRIRLPAAQVNLVNAGDAITCRFTHLDMDTPQDLPVVRRNVIPAPGRRDMYDVDLELTTRVSMAGPGGGDGGGGPFVETCDIANVAVVQNAHGSVSSPSSNPHIDIEGASWASPPTPGNLL